MNPMDMMRMFMGKGGSPKQMVMNMITKNNNNPIFKNLIEMAEKGDSKGVENFARNFCKENGMDFEKDFSDFKQFTSSFMK